MRLKKKRSYTIFIMLLIMATLLSLKVGTYYRPLWTREISGSITLHHSSPSLEVAFHSWILRRAYLLWEKRRWMEKSQELEGFGSAFLERKLYFFKEKNLLCLLCKLDNGNGSGKFPDILFYIRD